jgi:hypothetical protein
MTVDNGIVITDSMLDISARAAITDLIDTDVRIDATSLRIILWQRVRAGMTRDGIASRLIQIGVEKAVNLTSAINEVTKEFPFQINQRVVRISELGENDEPIMYRFAGLTDSGNAHIISGKNGLNDFTNTDLTRRELFGIPNSDLLRYQAYEQIQWAIEDIVKAHHAESLKRSHKTYSESLDSTRPGLKNSLIRILGRINLTRRQYRETIEASKKLLLKAKEKLVDTFVIIELTKSQRYHTQVNGIRVETLLGISVNKGRELVDSDFQHYKFIKHDKMRLDLPEIDYQGIIFVDAKVFERLRREIKSKLPNRQEQLRDLLIKRLSGIIN